MRVGQVVASIVAVATGIAVANLPSRGAPSPTASTDPTRLIGTQVPNVQLRTLAGDRVSLDSARAGKPTLLIVTKASDGASCASFAFEVRLLRRKLPEMTILLVGSGPEAEAFRSYFAEERVQQFALLDSERALATALELRSEPTVLLLDRDGNVLLVDSRSPGRSAQFPIGRVLPGLSESLVSLRP